MYCVRAQYIDSFGNTTEVYDQISSDLVFFNLTIISNIPLYTSYPSEYGWIRMSLTRCNGFPALTLDVGYGTCTPLPYEIFQLEILCICATTNCNANMLACSSSVGNSVNYPQYNPIISPAHMVPLVSNFTSPVSCIDDGVTLSNGSLSGTYTGCLNSVGNRTLCNVYYASHSVMCSISKNIFLTMGQQRYSYILEKYDGAVSEAWQLIHTLARNARVQFQFAESSTALFVFLPTANGAPSSYYACFCTTNNCNTNLSVCTSSLSFNQTAFYGILNVTNTSGSTTMATQLTSTSTFSQISFRNSTFATSPMVTSSLMVTSSPMVTSSRMVTSSPMVTSSRFSKFLISSVYFFYMFSFLYSIGIESVEYVWAGFIVDNYDGNIANLGKSVNI